MNGYCKGFCKREDFPIVKLANRDVYTYELRGRTRTIPRQTFNIKAHTSARFYNYKHRKQGLAKCKTCDYITAAAIAQGSRCKCCSGMLARATRTHHRVKTIRHIKPSINLQKEIITLHKEGKSIRTIAAATGISPSTVMRRIKSYSLT